MKGLRGSLDEMLREWISGARLVGAALCDWPSIDLTFPQDVYCFGTQHMTARHAPLSHIAVTLFMNHSLPVFLLYLNFNSVA